MRTIISIAFVILVSFQGMTQPKELDKDHLEKIKAHKIGFLTERLDLTPEEAQKFWPLYNEFEAEREATMGDLLKDGPGKGPKIETMSDEELDNMVLQKLQQEKSMVDLKIEYYDKFKKILPVRKVFLLYQSEIEFRRQLLERFRQQDKPPRK